MYKGTWKLSKMCTQLYQDFGKKMLYCRIHLKRQNLSLQQQPQKENNPHAETMKSHQCNFACGCYARLHGDYLWHWALQLAAYCITHLHNKQHSTAAGLEPGQSSLPLVLAAVLWENALSHFKTKGRKWSKGDSWGEKEKSTTTTRQSCTSKRDICNFFSKSGV